MSSLQASLLYKYNDHVFTDGTFFAAPKATYQIIIIRIHNIIEDIFYIIGYGVLSDKEMASYIELLDNIKTYLYNNRENKRVEKENLPKSIHYDFELALIGAIRKVYPNTEIKFMSLALF